MRRLGALSVTAEGFSVVLGQEPVSMPTPEKKPEIPVEDSRGFAPRNPLLRDPRLFNHLK